MDNAYASLTWLKRLQLNKFKVDQSFVPDILVGTNEAAFARMVIELADTLGVSVIAEGVETQGHRGFLASKELTCHNLPSP